MPNFDGNGPRGTNSGQEAGMKMNARLGQRRRCCGRGRGIGRGRGAGQGRGFGRGTGRNVITINNKDYE